MKQAALDVSGWDAYDCDGCGMRILGGWRFMVWDNRLHAPEPAYTYDSMHCPYCGTGGIPLKPKVNDE